MSVDEHDGLAITPEGRPTQPLRSFRLDDWHDADPACIARTAEQVSRAVPLSVGMASRPPAARLRPLLEALSMTLAGPDADSDDRQLVIVPDPERSLLELVKRVERCPRASLALGQLLRQTSCLDTVPGLAAEAAVYSMLLSGTEFAAWLGDRGAIRPPAPTGRPLVRMHRDGARLSLVLDHPERRNAFSFGMREELFAALELAELDDTIEQVELTGSGAAFCSGGDLAEFGTATDLVAAFLVRLDRAPWRLIDRLRGRVTVRIHGVAVGAGIELAAFADRVIAEPGAFFLLPETGMGLVPGAGGTVSVPRRIGRWRAAWMFLSGSRIDARTALEWGLIDEIGEP